MLDGTDIALIHQLLGRYGHTIDHDDWEGLAELFIADAAIDYQGTTGRVIRHGREAIVDWFREGAHPAAHHVTNIVVDESAERDGPTEVHSKFIVPFSRDEHIPKRLYGGDYRDTVVRTAYGWRFSEKQCIPRWNLALQIDDAAPPNRTTY